MDSVRPKLKLNTKRLGLFLAIGMVLLLIPLVAMQFTSEVQWTLGDFLVAGVLFFTASLLIELILSSLKVGSLKVLGVMIVLIMFILIFIELAVGIFNTPFAGS